MLFNEKLDTLMKAISVTNSQLGKAINVDPSLISRWRTGKRLPTGKNDYISAIASFFAARAKKEYQKAALYDILGFVPENGADAGPLQATIINWLGSWERIVKSPVNSMLDNMKLPVKHSITLNEGEGQHIPEIQQKVEVFYDSTGMKAAMIRFLNTVLTVDKPCNLMLFSDESLNWLQEDKTYCNNWFGLLLSALSKGHRLKIIHNLQRELSDMISMINHWLPIYMTGAVEGYYCPKYRDNIFRNTIFIAPDIMALTSSSISLYSGHTHTLLYTDKRIISGILNEYHVFLNICRPLMRIFSNSGIVHYKDLIVSFDMEQTDFYSYSSSFSAYTMPETLFSRLISETSLSDTVKNEMLKVYKFRRDMFEKNIMYRKTTEIIILPSPEELSDENSGCYKVHMMGCTLPGYNKEDCSEHLAFIYELLNKYEKYNLIFASHGNYPDLYISVKEDAGVFIVKRGTSPVIFAIDQPDLNNVFHGYITDIINRLPIKDRNKKYTAKLIRKSLEAIK